VLSAMTDPTPERRRTLPRVRTLLTGKLVFDNGARSVDCIIRDKTGVGARVKLKSAEPIPSHVYLIDIKNGMALDSDVRWIKPLELGLTFLGAHDLREDVKLPALKAVRRIWMELAAR
jgi:hypothetical protein